MTIGKKPHRRLCRRPKYFQVPIGVTFRQHLQDFRRVTVAAMKKEMKLLKKSCEKERAELTQLEERFIRLRRECTRWKRARGLKFAWILRRLCWLRRRHSRSAPRSSLRSLMT